jgi:hypothetical protein
MSGKQCGFFASSVGVFHFSFFNRQQNCWDSKNKYIEPTERQTRLGRLHQGTESNALASLLNIEK